MNEVQRDANGVREQTPPFSLPYTMETEWVSYLILGIILLPFIGMYIYAALQHPEQAQSLEAV